MIVIAILPLVAAVVGLLIYVLASNPKTVEIGRLIFATAILVVWYVLASKTFRL
jgi:hypothetical protein